MKALKYIFFLLLIAVIGLAIYVAIQPNNYSFERSRIIEVPTSILFNKVNDYKTWSGFSPWLEQEPNATLTYGEKTSGVDGNYAWKGDILGEGSMKTIAVEDSKTIDQQINFIKPFEAQSNINWIFEPTENGTNVTWKMSGEQDFITKLFTTFMGSIESTTGPDFERGLFKLDSITKVEMKKYSIHINGITQHGGGFYLYNTASTKMSDFKAEMQKKFPEIVAYTNANSIPMAGKPFAIYEKWDATNNAVIFSCAIPTSTKIESSEANILTGQLQPFKSVKTTLKGDYENLKETWDKTMMYIKTNNLEIDESLPKIETYITDPKNTPNPSKWVTELFIPVK
jgi:effector-binding domain-containing protein/ribosome-associated toxin RatA of RatAB toxin-antitoxin module